MPRLRTLAGWESSGQSLTEYLAVGDRVDEELRMWFLEVLPPACWSSRCIQIGEAAGTAEDGRDTFSTLEMIDGHWTYTGEKATPPGERCLYYV